MKAKIERAWIRVTETGGVEMYEVVVRVDASKGKFIESIHHRYTDAQARIGELLRSDTTVELRELAPTR